MSFGIPINIKLNIFLYIFNVYLNFCCTIKKPGLIRTILILQHNFDN